MRRMLDFIGEPFDAALPRFPREPPLCPHRELCPSDRAALRRLALSLAPLPQSIWRRRSRSSHRRSSAWGIRLSEPKLNGATPPDRQALLALANQHEQEGRLDEAEAVLDGILAEAPDDPARCSKRASSRFGAGRAPEAAALMERSIALAPNSALFHRNLCEVYRALMRHDDALRIGRRAVELDPKDPHCHHNLGVLHYDRLELDGGDPAAPNARWRSTQNFAGGAFRHCRSVAVARRFRPRLGGIRMARAARRRAAADAAERPAAMGRQSAWAQAAICCWSPTRAMATSSNLPAISRGRRHAVADIAVRVQQRAAAGRGAIAGRRHACSTIGNARPILPPVARCRACRASPARAWHDPGRRSPICAPTKRNSRSGRTGSGRCCRAATAASALSGPAGRRTATTRAARPGSRRSRHWRHCPEVALVSLQKGPAQAEIGNYWGARAAVQPRPRDPRFRRHDGVRRMPRARRHGRHLGRPSRRRDGQAGLDHAALCARLALAARTAPTARGIRACASSAKPSSDAGSQ